MPGSGPEGPHPRRCPRRAIFRRPGRRFLLHVVAGAGTAIIILPWLFARLGDQGAGPPQPFSFEWHTPGFKLGGIFAYTLDNFTRREGQRFLGWRRLKTDNTSLGDSAKAVEPAMFHAFIGSNYDDPDRFERKLFPRSAG